MSLQDSFTGTPNAGATNFGGATWQAQTFTASSTYSFDTVDLVFYDGGGADADVTVELWGVDGSNKPNPSDIKATCTAISSGLMIASYPSETYTTFTFITPFDVNSGTMYAIVWKAPDETNAAQAAKNNAGYTGAPHQSSNSGVDWSATADDYLFKANGIFNSINVTPSDTNYTKQLVAIANDEVWHESSAGTMAELTAANGDVDCGEILNIFEGYGKVFVVNKTNLKVADFQSSKIATANIGANPPDPGTVLTGGSSGAAMAVEYITALSSASTIYGFRTTAATFTTGETVTGTDDDGNAISFVMTAVNEVAAPHWYDWTTFGNDSSYGVMPTQATLGALFRGRAVISGNQLEPHQWYMSRQAGPFDFLYGINDAQAAVAGNNTDAGEIGDVVTALISYKDDFFIFGCANSIWYLTGDPTSGGSLDELSLTTGIFGANSWCWGRGNTLYFWGNNGIYKVTLPGGIPECMSEIRLPKLVDDEAVNPSTHRITMSYDQRRAGINIAITLLSDGSNSNYWYDLRTEGFFPESYPNECGIYSSVNYEAVDPAYRQVMYGGNDGFVRTFFDDQKDDDAGASGDTAVSSYVTFGPFLLSNLAMNEGKIIELDVILGADVQGSSQSDSDSVSYELYTGKSAKEVLEKMVDGTPISAAGTVTGSGRSRNTFRRKVRGVYGGLKLKNVTIAETWALEQILIDVAKAGRLK